MPQQSLLSRPARSVFTLLAGLLSIGAATPVAAQFIQISGVGDDAQGADVVVTNLDGDPRPEMILMAYDAPGGDNSFRYRVGFNLDLNLVAAGWTPNPIIVPGVGDDAQGAGAAITNLDDDSRPEPILMAYDAPQGPNSFRYRVGFNLGPDGLAARWSTEFLTIAGVSDDADGADIVVTNLDDYIRPEILPVAYDAPPGRTTSAIASPGISAARALLPRWIPISSQ